MKDSNRGRPSRIGLIEPVVLLATILQWLLLATLTGLVVGSGTSLFLHGLFYMTDRAEHLTLPTQAVLLPIGGLLNGLLLYYGCRLDKSGLSDSIIRAVWRQAGRLPLRTLAIKPVAAIITLASGGSAGKEGPCSHIGASLASALAQALRLNVELRVRLVACGVSAGFASVFGTPIAGAIYGVEVLAIGYIRQDFLLPAVVAGIASFEVSKFWGIPYTYFPAAAAMPFTAAIFAKVLLVALGCGMAAWLFVEGTGLARRLFHRAREKFRLWQPLMPLIGGLLLSALVLALPVANPGAYLGLSLPLMDDALRGGDVAGFGFFWKILFVAITLGSGFYGGIVTPQFVIGAVAGNAFATALGISPVLGAAAGLVAMVAASSNTPIAAILMGLELFGTNMGAMYLGAAAMVAYVLIGHRSVYPDQMVYYPKSSWLHYRTGRSLGEEKIHLSFGLRKWLSTQRHEWREWREGEREKGRDGDGPDGTRP